MKGTHKMFIGDYIYSFAAMKWVDGVLEIQFGTTRYSFLITKAKFVITKYNK